MDVVQSAGTLRACEQVVLDRDILGREWREAGTVGAGGGQVGRLDPRKPQEMPGGRGERRGMWRCAFLAVCL